MKLCKNHNGSVRVILQYKIKTKIARSVTEAQHTFLKVTKWINCQLLILKFSYNKVNLNLNRLKLKASQRKLSQKTIQTNCGSAVSVKRLSMSVNSAINAKFLKGKVQNQSNRNRIQNHLAITNHYLYKLRLNNFNLSNSFILKVQTTNSKSSLKNRTLKFLLCPINL